MKGWTDIQPKFLACFSIINSLLYWDLRFSSCFLYDGKSSLSKSFRSMKKVKGELIFRSFKKEQRGKGGWVLSTPSLVKLKDLKHWLHCTFSASFFKKFWHNSNCIHFLPNFYNLRYFKYPLILRTFLDNSLFV